MIQFIRGRGLRFINQKRTNGQISRFRFPFAPYKQFINGQIEPFLERAVKASGQLLKLLTKLLMKLLIKLLKLLTKLLLKLFIKLLLQLRIRSLDKVHKEDAATR